MACTTTSALLHDALSVQLCCTRSYPILAGVLAYLCSAYTETERSYGPDTDRKLHSVRIVLSIILDVEIYKLLRVGLKLFQLFYWQVLKLHICLAPYKVAVLPLDETNEKLCLVRMVF